jgi:hypothetical protein
MGLNGCCQRAIQPRSMLDYLGIPSERLALLTFHIQSPLLSGKSICLIDVNIGNRVPSMCCKSIYFIRNLEPSEATALFYTQNFTLLSDMFAFNVIASGTLK